MRLARRDRAPDHADGDRFAGPRLGDDPAQPRRIATPHARTRQLFRRERRQHGAIARFVGLTPGDNRFDRRPDVLHGAGSGSVTQDGGSCGQFPFPGDGLVPGGNAPGIERMRGERIEREACIAFRRHKAAGSLRGQRRPLRLAERAHKVVTQGHAQDAPVDGAGNTQFREGDADLGHQQAGLRIQPHADLPVAVPAIIGPVVFVDPGVQDVPGGIDQHLVVALLAGTGLAVDPVRVDPAFHGGMGMRDGRVVTLQLRAIREPRPDFADHEQVQTFARPAQPGKRGPRLTALSVPGAQPDKSPGLVPFARVQFAIDPRRMRKRGDRPFRADKRRR